MTTHQGPDRAATISLATTLAAAGAALLLTLVGCGGSGGGDTPTGPTARAEALRAFAGTQACDELETYLEDQAVATMRAQLQASRDGKPGWGGWDPLVITVNGGVPTATGDTGATSAPIEYTGTNLRTAGVDEADIVKNDGTRIVALAGQTLQVLRSWPAEQLALQGSLAIEGWPLELFMDGHDRALVFSTLSSSFGRIGFDTIVCVREGCGTDVVSRVKLTEVDLTDPAHPTVARELVLPGNYVSARKIDRTLRIVLRDNLRFPAEMRWFPAWDERLWADPVRLRAAWDQLIADNERLIRAQPLAAWLPAAQLGSGSAAQSLPQACSEFARVNAPTRLGTVTLATWQLASGTLGRTTVLAEAGTVYASAKNLYLVTPRWWSWPEVGQSDQSYIHQFDISRADRSVYLASGKVEGTVGDAFALDEADSGHLRVVSTVQRRVADPVHPDNSWGRLDTAVRLTVLQPLAASDGNVLAEVGRTPDLAPGERVMSARLLGARGFVVTFRQVDPLFAIDLADPKAPKVVGELKIPGFSSYLHPIDETHLLGLGTYVPEPQPGVPLDPSARGLQLSIFDVSDLSAPRQTFTQRVGSSSGYSEAQWDHRAFTYLAPRGLLALPYTAWEWAPGPLAAEGRLRSEVQLWRVDASAGLALQGTLPLGDMVQRQGSGEWSWLQQAWPRRSVIADDWLYAVTDLGVRVARVDALKTPVATALYPPPALGQ